MRKLPEKFIKDIARMMTDDPDVFVENEEKCGRCGTAHGSWCPLEPRPKSQAQVPRPKPKPKPKGKWQQDVEKVEGYKKAAGVSSEMCESAPTHNCRNTVYRRGTVMFCGRSTSERICNECKEARESIKEYVMGETTAAFSKRNRCKSCSTPMSPRDSRCRTCWAANPSTAAEQPAAPQAPSGEAQAKRRKQFYETADSGKSSKSKKKNSPDQEKVDDKFKVHDGYDEERKEPAKPGKQKRKSSLQKGPEGAKQPKNSPYLKGRK